MQIDTNKVLDVLNHEKRFLIIEFNDANKLKKILKNRNQNACLEVIGTLQKDMNVLIKEHQALNILITDWKNDFEKEIAQLDFERQKVEKRNNNDNFKEVEITEDLINNIFIKCKNLSGDIINRFSSINEQNIKETQYQEFANEIDILIKELSLWIGIDVKLKKSIDKSFGPDSTFTKLRMNFRKFLSPNKYKKKNNELTNTLNTNLQEIIITKKEEIRRTQKILDGYFEELSKQGRPYIGYTPYDATMKEGYELNQKLKNLENITDQATLNALLRQILELSRDVISMVVVPKNITIERVREKVTSANLMLSRCQEKIKKGTRGYKRVGISLGFENAVTDLEKELPRINSIMKEIEASYKNNPDLNQENVHQLLRKIEGFRRSILYASSDNGPAAI